MEYKTLRAPSEAEFVERRSRFIGRAFPITTEEEALEHLKRLRSQHWDATHNVYAYVLRSGTARFSDDGEPQGTSGMPTLDVLTKRGITDALIVTTRYFGGILLGGGGLVRAYSKAANDAVEAAGIVTMRMCKSCLLECAYGQYNTVVRILGQKGAVVDDTEYGAGVTITFHIVPADIPALERALADATAGSVELIEDGEAYLPFDE
jgi:uncharacterized YigZ family protein